MEDKGLQIPLLHTDIDTVVRSLVQTFVDVPDVEIEARVGIFRYIPSSIPPNKVSEFIEHQENTPKKLGMPRFAPPYLNEVAYYWDTEKEKSREYFFDATVDNGSYHRILLALESAREHLGDGSLAMEPELTQDLTFTLVNFDTNRNSFLPEDQHVILNGQYRMTEYEDGSSVLIEKKKLATLDVVFPEPCEYGIRIQVSEEKPIVLSPAALEGLRKCTPNSLRQKNRVSYFHEWLRFDNTRVVETIESRVSKVMNQVELEIFRPTVIREAKRLYLAGEPEAFNKAVYSFWTNARMLCMAASKLLILYEPTELSMKSARALLELKQDDTD